MILQRTIRKEASRFLRDNHTAVMATCLDGEPHASTIYYDVDEDFNMYFLTKKNTQKNIHSGLNKRSAIVVGTGPEAITVQMRGRAEVLIGEEKTQALLRMMVRYSRKGVTSLPILKMKELREVSIVAYRISPVELIFMNMDSKRYKKTISESYYKII